MFEDKFFRNQFIVAISIAGGITLLLIVILIVLGSKISNTTYDILSQKTEIMARQQKVEALSTLEKDAASAQKYVSILENSLPTKDELITFNQELDAIAKRTNTNVSFAFGAETGAITGGVQSITFQIVINGNVEQILNFFREMNKSRFIINVSDMDLTKQGSIFKGILGGQVYFQS